MRVETDRMTPDELETLPYDKPPKREAWYRQQRANEALKEFLELFYVETTPLERIFMLTFVSWCCKWIPETGYAYLLKAIVTHLGPTDTLAERPALWSAILEPMPAPRWNDVTDKTALGADETVKRAAQS